MTIVLSLIQEWYSYIRNVLPGGPQSETGYILNLCIYMHAAKVLCC